MIVLDDHFEVAVAEKLRKLPGEVRFLRELRPGQTIKDELVPTILLEHRHCSFITLNWRHFWRVFEPHSRFYMISLSLSSADQLTVPALIHRLFRTPGFGTRAERAGKIARVTTREVSYYVRASGPTTTLALSP